MISRSHTHTHIAALNVLLFAIMERVAYVLGWHLINDTRLIFSILPLHCTQSHTLHRCITIFVCLSFAIFGAVRVPCESSSPPIVNIASIIIIINGVCASLPLPSPRCLWASVWPRVDGCSTVNWNKCALRRAKPDSLNSFLLRSIIYHLHINALKELWLILINHFDFHCAKVGGGGGGGGSGAWNFGHKLGCRSARDQTWSQTTTSTLLLLFCHNTNSI